MPEPEVHNRAGEPLEVHNRARDPIELRAFGLPQQPAIIHALLNKPRQMPERVGTITRRPTEFPPTQQVTQNTTSGSSVEINFSFQLENASVGNTPKVLIRDGEVNGETPIGMGTDSYVLTVYDGAFINLIVTYDTSSLAVTSLTFEVNSFVPDPTLGTFYIEIGRTYVDFGDTGNISSFTPVNTQCGDINFQLIYGAVSGQPALIPVAVYSGWVSAAAI